MDSKSVHRVCEGLKVRSHYDNKLKLWRFEHGNSGDALLTLTSDELAKLKSSDLRLMLTNAIAERDPQRESVEAEAQQAGAALDAQDSKRGGSLVAAATQMLDAAVAKHHAAPAAKQKKPAAAKVKAARPKRGESKGVVKISAAVKKTPKRVSEDDKGKHWLKKIGIDKSQLKRKSELHSTNAEQRELLKRETQYYTASELKKLVPVIFNDADKATLKDREQHTAYAIKCAEEARKIAEDVLALSK